MTVFSVHAPGQILFGRGQADRAAGLVAAYGTRGVLVHGANPSRAAAVLRGLQAAGCVVVPLTCATEPTLAMLNDALTVARPFAPLWVLAIGGGAALDLGKALAALIPAPGSAMDHLEVVGKGLPLTTPPLPFIALPTTAGTGAEATKNAVIGLPDHRRKVSLRDDRMLARLVIVDPALTDGCPWSVTLASGLDAVVQVIEPYVSLRATPFTDALALPAIGQGLRALQRLQQGDDPKARDDMAWVSLCGGLALANAGLGAVHGLAGPIGGMSPAPHGAVCGALIGPVLAMNRTVARQTGITSALERLNTVCTIIAQTLGGDRTDAPGTLARWARTSGLPTLATQGLAASTHAEVVSAASASSSMKGNPVLLSQTDLHTILTEASR